MKDRRMSVLSVCAPIPRATFCFLRTRRSRVYTTDADWLAARGSWVIEITHGISAGTRGVVWSILISPNGND